MWQDISIPISKQRANPHMPMSTMLIITVLLTTLLATIALPPTDLPTQSTLAINTTDRLLPQMSQVKMQMGLPMTTIV